MKASETAEYYQNLLARVREDQRYQENLLWGDVRTGHPEGTIHAHIMDLQNNLGRLTSKVSFLDYCKLLLLIHTHDTFKPNATRRVPIEDPRSHASLAAQFLKELGAGDDVVQVAQFHDMPYALWRRLDRTPDLSEIKARFLYRDILDMNLFRTFLIIDGCTEGKSRDPIKWFFDLIGPGTSITVDDILQ
jgi:hypothetical protein